MSSRHQVGLTFFTFAVPQGQELSLVAANGTKTLLISAYQEHRTGKKEVSKASRSLTMMSFTTCNMQHVHSTSGFNYS